MNLATLREELAAGGIRPAYLLAGDEPLLRDDALAAIQDAVLEPGAADFNLDRLTGSEATPTRLLNGLRTLPVMADRRLVVLRDPESARGGAKALGDALVEAITELAADEEVKAVLVVTTAKPDARVKWVKAFGDARVECAAPRREKELAAFARAEAKAQGVSLDKGAAELLAERVGPQLLMMRQEIAKAALLAGPGEPIGRSHVSAGTADVSEEPIWDLTDAIGEGRAPDALALLGKLLAAGSPPIVVLGALASHFRRLTRVRNGGNVGGPPFIQRKLQSQAARYGPRQLLSCLAAIHQTDLALKGEGRLKPEMALERLVLGLSG
jgi:DNA polymerase-3 subunit delta